METICISDSCYGRNPSEEGLTLLAPTVNYVVGVDGSDMVYLSGGKEGGLVLTIGTAKPRPIAQAAFCALYTEASPDDITVTPGRHAV